MPASRHGGGGDDPQDARVVERQLGRSLQEVDLVQHHDLRPLVEAGAIRRQLTADRLEAFDEVSLRGVEHVHEQACALEMREELVPETCSVRSSFDQPGNVRHRELPCVRAVDRAQNRLDRGERIVGDLRLRIRDAAEERGLACVREAGKCRVDDELEP